MHALRTSRPHLLQQLPGPPLPEMSDRGSGSLDRCASARTAAHALLARGLHAAPSLAATGAAEQKDPLRSPIPYQCRNPSRSRSPPETSGCGNWLLQRLAHLEPKAHRSSACPLCRAGWRPLPRSHSLGSLPRQLLSSQGSAAGSFSRQVRRRSQRGFSKWPTALPRRPEASGTTQDLRRLAAATPSTGLGGVLETSLRGPRIRGALFGPLHSSRGHLQPPPGFLC